MSTRVGRGQAPTTPKGLTIKEARKILKEELGDSEGYHSVYDELVEQKLMELDPKFMKAMQKLYYESNESRWYA